MFLRKCVLSDIVIGAGDILCQTITKNSDTLDQRQVARFALVGATIHAPYWFYGFRLMDKLPLGPISVKTAIIRSLSTQLLLSTPYFILFYSCIGVLEGLTTYDQIIEHKKQPIIDTVRRGFVFWPIINVFNFRFMAPAHRLHVVTVAGVFWNALVSYANKC